MKRYFSIFTACFLLINFTSSFSNIQWEFIPLNENYIVSSIALDSSGNLWAGTVRNGLWKYDIQKSIWDSLHIAYDTNLIYPVRQIELDSQGNIYFIYDDKLSCIEVGTNKLINIDVENKAFEGISLSYSLDYKNELWICGLSLYRTKDKGITWDTISNSSQTTINKIYRFSDSTFYTYSWRNGFSYPFIYKTEDYFNTWDEFIGANKYARSAVFIPELNRNNFIYNDNPYLWQGLARVIDKNNAAIDKGLPMLIEDSLSIQNFGYNNDGRIIIYSNKHGLYLLSGGINPDSYWIHLSDAESTVPISSIVVDKNGILYVGSVGGVYRSKTDINSINEIYTYDKSYANYSNGILKFSNLQEDKYTVFIYNLTSEILDNFEMIGNSINLEIPNGIYFYQLQQNDKTQFGKFIVLE